MTFDTPVAVFIFNRPHLTQMLFFNLKKMKPKTLLLVSDGARPHVEGELEKVEATRAIFEFIDWDCTVLRDFSDHNLGCGTRVRTGLDWVFSQCEEAIILEDDCMPDPSFMLMCQELLQRYADDERVMAIGGDNFQFGQRTTPWSYYFSRWIHCWGWATWRRAWALHDHRMPHWPELRQDGWLDYVLDNPAAVRYWTQIFDAVHAGQIDTWDYQWVYTVWRNSGLSIIPATNLVSNVGFGEDATHTTVPNMTALMEVTPLKFPLAHPPQVLRDFLADAAYSNRFHQVPRRGRW